MQFRPASEQLKEKGADEAPLAAWREIVESKIEPQAKAADSIID
jgi:hypothetical protein